MVPRVGQIDGGDHRITEGIHTVESIVRNESFSGVGVLNVYLD
jgi:hypothetical protein